MDDKTKLLHAWMCYNRKPNCIQQLVQADGRNLLTGLVTEYQQTYPGLAWSPPVVSLTYVLGGLSCIVINDPLGPFQPLVPIKPLFRPTKAKLAKQQRPGRDLISKLYHRYMTARSGRIPLTPYLVDQLVRSLMSPEDIVNTQLKLELGITW